MKARFIANAGFVLDLAEGARLATDPWLTGGAYYGSWWNYPPVPDALRASAHEGVDAVYISHLHPDHLDREFLAHLPPDVPVVIGRLGHDHLRRAVHAARPREIIECDLGQPVSLGGAMLTVIGPFGEMGDGQPDLVAYEMDTSLHVRDADGATLLHLVDNPISPERARQLVAELGPLDVAIVPYSGASLYPHAFSYSSEEKDRRTGELREAMLERFVAVARELGAKVTIPAAGSYVMGGRLAGYNRWLHQATPAELREAWSSAGLEADRLLVMGPGDQLDTAAGDPPASTADFTRADRERYGESLREAVMPQDAVHVPAEFNVPWPRLLTTAERRLRARQELLGVHPDVTVRVVVRPTEGLPSGAEHQFSLAAPDSAPPDACVEFRVDAGLMLMLLNGAAVWNNAEIGALLEVDRDPDRYEPAVHALMAYFTLV